MSSQRHDAADTQLDPGSAWHHAPARRARRFPRSDLRAEIDGMNAPAESGVRVLCVDDHEVLIEGLKAQFSLDGSMRIVGWLDSAARLVEEAKARRAEVVLLDIEMPGPDVFEMASRLHHEMPQTRIIFLSAHVRETFLAAAYRCGASGYFSKADRLSELVQGIRTVAARAPHSAEEAGFVLGSKVRERCLRHALESLRTDSRQTCERPPSASTRLSALSDREIEVLRLIGKGLTREAIARQLSRSVKTIDGHQLRIKNKLGVESREDLILFAIREGLAEVQ